MPPRPNILVFLTDDHGQWASSPYGNRDLHTPALQHLADHGTRFANAFTPSPVCSPARASFWTGTRPSWHGVHDYIRNGGPAPQIGDPDDAGAKHPGIGDQSTLATALRAAGYRTAIVGKWHAHHKDHFRGDFDHAFVTHGTNANFGDQPFTANDAALRFFPARRASARVPTPHGYHLAHFQGHQTPLITRSAEHFLTDHAEKHASRGGSRGSSRGSSGGGSGGGSGGSSGASSGGSSGGGGEPFFLCVGYTETHTPFAGSPPRLVDHYARHATFADIPPGETPPPGYTPRWGRVYNPNPSAEPASAGGSSNAHPLTPQHRAELAQYYAAVTHIDENVGRLLDLLDTLALTDDTLILYTADHGHLNGHHGLTTKGNATVPQNFLEESIRIPLLAKWPARLAPGTVDETPADLCDLFTTVLTAADAPPPDTAPRPGRALFPPAEPAAAGVSSPPTPTPGGVSTSGGGSAAPIQTPGGSFHEYGNARCIRTPRFKLIRRTPGPNGTFPDELYALTADPRETTNVITDPAHAAAVADLTQQLDAHFAAYEHPARRGVDIDSQPHTGGAEPWRLDPATL